MIDIFEYTDYRKYLRDLFNEKKRNNPAFSHRMLARKLGLSTSNYVMLIMQGKRNIGPDLRSGMSLVFGHTRKETEYFEEMVNFAHAKTDAEKNRHFSRMVLIRKNLKKMTLDDSQYEYFNNWYNTVIRELVTSTEWNGDYGILGRMVRPAISAAQAKRSLDLLVRCGLIAVQNGKCIQSSSVITAEKSTLSPSVTSFHRDMCIRAMEALDSADRENRSMTGCTLNISKKTFNLIREELAQCRLRILELAQVDNNADSVYHLNLHLFPMSAPIKKKRPRRCKKPDTASTDKTTIERRSWLD